MMLQRSASESAFPRSHQHHHRTSPPLTTSDPSRRDSGTTEEEEEGSDGTTPSSPPPPQQQQQGATLTSTPSVRTLPGRSSFTTPPSRRGSHRDPAGVSSTTTSSSSTSRLAGTSGGGGGGSSSKLRPPSTTSSTAAAEQRTLQPHRALSKTTSQQTVLSGASSNTAFSRTAWASEDSVDDAAAGGGRKSRKRPSKSRRHLFLPPSPSDDGAEDKYERLWSPGGGKDTKDSSSPAPKVKSPHRLRSGGGGIESPSSPNNNVSRDNPRSPGANPGSPKKLNSSRDREPHYRPHNEKFPIPEHNNNNIPASPHTPAAQRSPLRENVYDFPSPPPTAKSAPAPPLSRDGRYGGGDTTPFNGRPRKPSAEVLLEFPPSNSQNAKPQGGRTPQQQGADRARDTRRERGDRAQGFHPPSQQQHHHQQQQQQQVIRAAQSVPRLDAGRSSTPTNSPDRSTRPHSVGVRDRSRGKSAWGKTCDLFYFFRWGKKKDKGREEDKENHRRDGRRRGGNTGRHRSKSDNSESPSGSRGRSRSKPSSSSGKHSDDRHQASSSSDPHHKHHHSNRHHHHHHHRDSGEKEKHRHHHHRPVSSSASRPLRTPADAGSPASPQQQQQYHRQYRHHREKQHRQKKQQQQQQHQSPDDSRAPARQYTPSRTKRERPKQHRGRRGRQDANGTEDGRSLVSDGTVGLRHEDLPPHPSIAKKLLPAKTAGKSPKTTTTTPTVQGSYLKNTFVRAPTSGPDQLRRGWKRSRSESPSNLRAGSANSGSNPNLAGGGESSTGGGGGDGEGGRERERSQHSASRTDLDSAYHCTVSSTDQRHNNNTTTTPPSSTPAPARSRSFHGFESQQHHPHSGSQHQLHYFNPDADTKVITDAEDFEYKPSDLSGPLHLSFCGCGFVGMYHLGVVSCLLQRGETFLERVHKVAGASAGALMAAVMLCAPDRIEEVGEQIQALAHELRSRPLGALTPGYSFARALRQLLEEILPEDAHVTVKGRLHVSLTASAAGGGGGSGGGGGGGGEKGKKKKNNELMTDFETREELIEALVATSYTPLYAGLKMPVIRGKKYMDGGFSDNMPSFPTGRTITVSPFDGRSEIAPKAGHEAQKKAHFISFHNQEYQLNVRNMKKGAHAYFPPKRHVMQEYFNLGRFDASRFLIREGMYTIKLIHSSEKALYVSSV